MAIVLVFAFIAGVVTILSPCILPLLPIILAGGVAQNKYRPLGIATGFIASFTVSTVALSFLAKSIGLDANILRLGAIVIIAGFGVTLAVPVLRHVWEQIVSQHVPQLNTNKSGFWGGVVVGIGLGIVWTPCVGPILASVIALAASSIVTSTTVVIVLSYAVGTALPLFGIMVGSSKFVTQIKWLKNKSGAIQQFFGILMVATAVMLWQGWDRRFQSIILNRFPQYGTGLTNIENRESITTRLNELKERGGSVSQLKVYGDAPEIKGGGRWLNSDPLTLAGLRGKVVLVDFWTYSCINCIRTLPYLKAWHDAYSADGLVIIGVHTPEFEFEKEYTNVQKALSDFGIKYPVVQDNDYKIWGAYDNHYWPAKYLIDRSGKIRLIHFGEGNYTETESAIRELLGESNKDIVIVEGYSVESHSPETYVGYSRLESDVSTPSVKHDVSTDYHSPTSIPLNSLAFQGIWTVHDEYAEPMGGASLLYHFDAKDVNLVMRPVDPTKPADVEVYIDGTKISTQKIDKDRLYQLIHFDIRENHIMKIVFPAGGIAVYAFTFG